MAPGDFRGRLRALAATAAAESSSTVLRLQLPRQLADDLFAAIESRRQLLAATLAGDHPTTRQSAQDAAQLFSTAADTSPVPWTDRSVALQTARALLARRGRVPLWVGLLALPEDYIETWGDPQAVPRREAQAIYIRDGWRCAAPGCISRRQLESHHIVYRSRGGSLKDEANQICLCQFHHQQGEHGELASCHGSAPLGVAWRLGHPSVGAWFQNEMRL